MSQMVLLTVHACSKTRECFTERKKMYAFATKVKVFLNNYYCAARMCYF